MARDRLTFRQRDMAAAIKAVRAGGLAVARIDVSERGGFKVIIDREADASLEADAVEQGTQQIEEKLDHVYSPSPGAKAPRKTKQKRMAAQRVADAEPPRQR
jgi:hypothetical protein